MSEKVLWTNSSIKLLLECNPKAVVRGICAIYKYQTAQEQDVGQTVVDNGVGFNAVDAEILSSFVSFYKERGFLSPKQMVIAKKKVMKYAKQLRKIANGEYEIENIIRAL